jgi:hypothetical protein
VNGTNPPAPSGTTSSGSPQKKKKHTGVVMGMVVIVTGAVAPKRASQPERW